jgi:hypothetical protein
VVERPDERNREDQWDNSHKEFYMVAGSAR